MDEKPRRSRSSCPPCLSRSCPTIFEDEVFTHLRPTDSPDAPSAGPSTTEPIMKKARYLWQIKGHFHLKEEERKWKCQQQEEEMKHYENVIHKWQNKQLTRAYFDNTMNGLIDKTGQVNPDDGMDNLIEDYANPLLKGDDFMDEAVGQAIKSHGLHTPCMCPEVPYTVRSNVPFHRRNQEDDPGPSEPYLGSVGITPYKPEEFFLSEAVSAAIQEQGLGACGIGISSSRHIDTDPGGFSTQIPSLQK